MTDKRVGAVWFSLALVAALVVVGAAPAAQAQHVERLVVQKNQTHRIDVAQLRVRHLELQDGAVITFAPGITQALIQAQHTIIGSGVRINASGRTGVAGTDGRDWPQPAPNCEAGEAGGNGGDGGSGGDGVDLIVELGIERIGSLRIDAEGGVGGVGGTGGDGQRGGDIDRCYGKDGGPGGNGGNGGGGGNGGAVTLRYGVSNAQLTAADLVHAFSISVRGGRSGAGGKGGGGGGVVAGRYLNTAVGSGKKWLGAGDAGAVGAAGRLGMAGAAGSVNLLQQAGAEPAATVTSTQFASGNIAAQNAGADAEVEALRQRLRALEARVQALESAR